MKVWIAKPMTNCFSLTPFVNLWFYSTVIHLSFGWGKWSVTLSMDRSHARNSRCDNGACYNENLIEEQAVEIQKLKTKNNKLIESIGFAVYFMRESGYHCMDNIEPEFKMYREFKDVLDEVKKYAR